MCSTEPRALVRTLVKRWEFLTVLEGDPRTKRELEAPLDVSRSTVNRAVSELEAVDVIERLPSAEYRLTRLGRLVFHRWSMTLDDLATLLDAHARGVGLPTGEHGEAVAFRGATVTPPGPHRTDLPFRRFRARLREADRFLGVSPGIDARFDEAVLERVLDHGFEAELVTAPGVVEVASTPAGDPITAALETGGLAVRVADGRLPFGLGLFGGEGDRELGVLLYGRSGVAGFVRTDRPVPVGWGEQLFRRYRRIADPLCGGP